MIIIEIVIIHKATLPGEVGRYLLSITHNHQSRVNYFLWPASVPYFSMLRSLLRSLLANSSKQQTEFASLQMSMIIQVNITMWRLYSKRLRF